ncbi:hypothetical protein A2U01_0086476, partial [Trifolium medium]|nr:hypothetical protein [Trifolium medium]
MQERRNKGLCFNCDDKYHPGHRCSKRQFLLLLVDDDPAPMELLAKLDLLSRVSHELAYFPPPP